MLLYHNKTEYSRVVEVVDVTEDGMFAKDQTPEDYGGAVLQVEIVHWVTFTDTSGYLEILRFDNPVPMKKDKTPSDAAVQIDGNEYRAGSSPARTWTTVAAPNLPPAVKSKADITKQIMEADGKFGTKL